MLVNLVVDVGLMLGAWSWGGLLAFAKRGIKCSSFFSLSGGSAGAYNITYYALEQFAEGSEMWACELPRGFLLKGRRPNFDLNFLEGALCHSSNRLHFERISRLHRPLHIAVTNLRTHQLEFHLLNFSRDPLQTLLGTCRLPWNKRKIFLNGDLVADAGLSCQPPMDFNSIRADAKVWVISPYCRPYRLSTLRFAYYAGALGWNNWSTMRLVAGMPHRINRARRLVESLPYVRLLCPEQDITPFRRTTNEQEVRRLIALGEKAGEKFLRQHGNDLH